MDNRPVGIFDSGLGGLTAAAEFKKLMPRESIVYFGDTGRMPYGVRPVSEIKIIAQQNLDFVQSRGVKAVIAACGTISSTADDVLNACALPVCGVLKPGVKALCGGQYKTVGVIATATSINSGAYQREINALRPDMGVIAAGCPKFVPLIEQGRYSPEDEEVMAAIEEHLAPMKARGVQAVLLGCTHYGLIGAALRKFFGPEVDFISASQTAAAEMAAYIQENALAAQNPGEDSYYTSGSAQEFELLGKLFLGRDISGLVDFVPPAPVR